MSSGTSTQTGAPTASNLGGTSQENNVEPSPFEIANMTVVQQAMILQERAERENVHKWTYIETDVGPPAGYEVHCYPHQGQLMFVQRLVESTSLPLCGEATGYNMYREQYPASGNLLGRDEWNECRDMCIQCINAMIKDSHGVVCKLKSDLDSGLGTTLFHICDYITMLKFRTMKVADSRMAVQTMFKPSDATGPESDFPESVKNFIHANADYFFLCYGIWGNYSELPIVLVPPVETMQQAYTVMNINEFIAIQHGKQQALRFRFCGFHEDNLKFRNVL